MRRNQLLNTISSILFFMGIMSTGFSQNALVIPPALFPDEGEITLNMMPGTHEFVAGIQTPTWGYNGSYLGPTIILEKDDYIQFYLANWLNETTTVHWHGLDVPANTDGGATTHHHIHPWETSTPAFEILNRAGTYWYHPHPHENTEAHVVRGLAGLVIVRDDEEAALELPRTYGVDDIPFIIQDKTFETTDTSMTIVETGLSHVMVVNGVIEPHLDAPAQMLRFRALNGSASRHYMLGLNDSTDLIQIASDGGLLASPVTLPRIMLAPGERVEFLVNFNGRMGDTLSLMSFAPEMPEGAAGQGPVFAPGLPGENSPLNGAVFPILSITVTSPTDNPVTTLPPAQLSILPEMPDTTGLEVTRTLNIKSPNNGAGGPFNFNDEFYDEAVMNQIVTLGETEIWEIKNSTLIGHPFHLHGGSYYILERNGVAPPENERGVKDTWFINRGKRMRILVRFDNYSDNEVPYMYHCHMLGHEDGGLMGNVLVVDSTYVDTNEETVFNSNISIFPNPTMGNFQIKTELNHATDVTLEIFSTKGNTILKTTEKANGVFKKNIDISGYPSGIWFVRLTADGYRSTRKLVLISGN